jgi:Cd2+/Zn2+-exporting ATPase
MKGVQDVKINSLAKVVIVRHCPVACCAPAKCMLDQLNQANLGATLLSRDEDKNGVVMQQTAGELFRAYIDKLHVLLCWALFVVGVCLQDEADSGKVTVSTVILIACTVIGALPILRRALKAMVRLQIDMSALMSFAIIGALGSQEYHEAALVVCLFLSAEVVQHLAMARVEQALSAVMHLSATRTATRVADGKQVPVAELKVGEDIVLRPGEECPVDGVVGLGMASVSEAAMTGEAEPIEKTKDSNVISGCVVLNGYLEVKLTALPKDSTLAKIKEQVEEAQAQKGRAQQAVDRFAKYWTPLILTAVAVLLIIMPPATGTDFVHWLDRALILLVLACPCALIFAAPVPTTCAIAAAAQHLVLIKRPDVVEQLAQVSSVGVDKTGTLTCGEFAVVDKEEFPLPEFPVACGSDDAQRESAMRMCAALEAKSSHPMAAAIVSNALGCATKAYEGGSLPTVNKFKSVEGVGVSGEVEVSKDFFVPVIAGNAKVFDMANVSAADRQKFDAFVNAHMDDTNIAVVVGGVLVLAIALNDQIRGDAKIAVDRLRGLGCAVTMLTGDTDRAARPVASTLGIGTYKASMLPKDKREWIVAEEAKKVRSLMIGDGINDSSALAAASVGVAMGETSMALAARTADVVVMSDKLVRLPQCIQLCRYANRLVWCNIALAAVVKLGAVGLALAGELKLWMAVIVDAGSLLLVVLLGVSVLARRSVWRGNSLSEVPPKVIVQV